MHCILHNIKYKVDVDADFRSVPLFLRQNVKTHSWVSFVIVLFCNSSNERSFTLSSKINYCLPTALSPLLRFWLSGFIFIVHWFIRRSRRAEQHTSRSDVQNITTEDLKSHSHSRNSHTARAHFALSHRRYNNRWSVTATAAYKSQLNL